MSVVDARIRGRRGVSLIEALVSLAIFVILVGSVAYASRVALTVMTDSMRETRLLFRVRRALDQAEEQLSRSSRLSAVVITQDGWTLVGLDNWFAQVAQDNAGQPLGDAAEKVRSSLDDSRSSMQLGTPDFVNAELQLDRAITDFETMAAGGLISAADAVNLRAGFTQLRLDVLARTLVSLGGGGASYPSDWRDIEDMIASGDPLVSTEPLVSADQVMFREYVIGGSAPSYRPPLDRPPCAYYLRPMVNGDDFELVFYDGSQTSVVADQLSGARFDLNGDLLKITLMFEEERNGVTITRTEVRTVVLHVG